MEKQFLVLWISTKGQHLQRKDFDFWQNVARENQLNIEQRVIVESGLTSFEALEGVPVIEGNNLGITFNQIGKEKLWDAIWFVPVGINFQEIVEDYYRHSLGGDLDAITFYRMGGKTPFIRSIFYSLIRNPLFFLLEIPIEKKTDWLGWNNWFWEKIGGWLLGVPNRDPGFPFRVVKGDWLNRIPFQSSSSWIWMEMLAKLHFLGAKLSEKPIKGDFDRENVFSQGPVFKDFRLVLTKPEFRFEP